MHFLLRIKPWALFTLSVLPIALYTFNDLAFSEQPNMFLVYQVCSTACLVLMAGVIFSWLWIVGTQLSKLLPSTISLPIRWLKLAITLPSIYLLLILSEDVSKLVGASLDLELAFVIPAHLLSMAGIAYSVYFVAKGLKSMELQRPAAFSDFRGDFFLIWYFPIGMWLIQPRINRLFASTQGN